MIENDKLLLIPIDVDIIDSLLTSDDCFRSKYGFINDGGEFLNPSPKYLYEVKERLLTHPEEYPLAIDHLIIIKEIKTVIGTIYFKSLPIEGKTEIGYGMSPQYEGHGYMSKALSLMLNYGKSLGITTVFADTTKENIKSQNVLKRNGFALYKEKEDFLHFVKEL